MYSLLLKKIILPIADIVMHTKVSHYYSLIKKMQYYSSDEIKKWQNKKLHELINHSYYNTKYYKRLFDNNNISPDDIKSIEDLNKIPILTKEIIKKNYSDLIPSNIESVRHISSSTGGSTGEPLKFNLDLDSWSYIVANTILYWEKTKYKYGDKYLAIGSTSLFVSKKSLKHHIYYKLKNRIGVNGANMSNDVMEGYLN